MLRPPACSLRPIMPLLIPHAPDPCDDLLRYAVCMKRTTIFLSDEIERMLHATARRTGRPRAEIVRDALRQYFQRQTGPWPRSIGMGERSDQSVTSENVKDWVRECWRPGADL